MSGSGRLISALLISALAALAMLPAGAAARQVDLELVLAMDASGSVDAREYHLQREGIAAAIQAPEVLQAIAAGPRGRIAVCLLIWAEANEPKASSAWFEIADARDAAAFAAAIRAMGRPIPAGGTGIGMAVLRGIHLIRRNRFEAPRRTIDVSGDGRETTFRDYSVPARQARARADAFAITVNGLAIEADDPELARWYRRHMIAGPDAFVMRVARFADLRTAMIAKLRREITGEALIGRTPSASPPSLFAAATGRQGFSSTQPSSSNTRPGASLPGLGRLRRAESETFIGPETGAVATSPHSSVFFGVQSAASAQTP